MFSRQSKTMRVPLRAGPLALTAILTLGGCTVGPRFEAPQAQTPPTWNDPSAGSAAAAAEVDPRWWRAYGDPVLDSLMERALAAGGRDNVTIVVVDVVATPALVDESTETRPKRRKATKVVADPQPTDLQATDLNLGAPKGVPPKGAAPNLAAPKLADRPVMPTFDLSAEAIELVPLDAIAGAGELLSVDQPAGGELIAGAPVPFEEPDEQEPQQVRSAVPLVEMITGGPPSSDTGEDEDEGSGDRDG